jgi:hypothetical protein
MAFGAAEIARAAEAHQRRLAAIAEARPLTGEEVVDAVLAIVAQGVGQAVNQIDVRLTRMDATLTRLELALARLDAADDYRTHLARLAAGLHTH